MHNEFEKNKRIFPEPCLITKVTPIPLPPADDKKLGYNGHVVSCTCNLCVTAKAASVTGGKGPGQDGWESVDGVDEGPVQANKYDKVLQTALDAMNAEGPQGRWPDGGINSPTRAKKPQLSLIQIADKSSFLVYPREDDKPADPSQKIHSQSLSQDFQRTSIDKLAQLVEDVAEDDENDWGGLGGVIDRALEAGLNQMGVDTEEIKYGPGNYPDDNNTSYRTPEFFHNIFAKEQSPFRWVVPGVLAIGPHPIFSSHLDDLSVLRKAGIKAIITAFNKQLEPKYLKGFHYFFAPTPDGYSNDLNIVCKYIETQEKLGNPVFVHSFHGNGRAATIAAAYLVHKGWLTGEEAIEWVRQHFDESAIATTAQEDAVLKFSIDTPSKS